MSLTLVVMAAGLGSRFGGTKQLAVIGADGEAFLDFAIKDALAAGMNKVVLIVRSDIEADVRRHVADQHPDLDVAYVLQDTHGPKRAKPWGTGHAVLTAAPEVPGAFCVLNADDYYGASTYLALAEAAADLPDDRALLAGFRLDQTLPEVGEVSAASVRSSTASSCRSWRPTASGVGRTVRSPRPTPRGASPMTPLRR